MVTLMISRSGDGELRQEPICSPLCSYSQQGRHTHRFENSKSLIEIKRRRSCADVHAQTFLRRRSCADILVQTFMRSRSSRSTTRYSILDDFD